MRMRFIIRRVLQVPLWIPQPMCMGVISGEQSMRAIMLIDH